MKPLFRKATLVLSLVIISACGDIKSAQEVLGNRAREQSSQRRAEIDPLQGEYEGYLLDERSDRKARFRLNIFLSGTPYDGASIPEEITTPTLTANALVYSSESGSDTYITVPFSTSDYDVKTGRLSFFSDGKDSTLLLQLPPGKASAPIDTLDGRYVSGARGTIGSFVVTRIQR